ncbi:MAG: family 16 glycosylhydrolase [Terrimonas sp.]|nr:family 16 glycosylhydrolase [Terrimonas sp.]
MKIFLFFFLVIDFTQCAFHIPSTAKKMVWHDEFEQAGLPDSTKWNYDTGGHGWGNREIQFYTSHRKENARVENGSLILEARREKWEGADYSSARLHTKGKGDWQYGEILVRAMIPQGRGTWPAIWMLGSNTPFHWPEDGEIDIMEHVGFNQGFIQGSVHCRGRNETDTIEIPDCSSQFHVYGLEWDKDTIRTSVDGKVYFRYANDKSGYSNWPFDNKMHLLLNIAVGGNWGGQKGIDTSIWPQQMIIDYVRVYQ